jgi:uncharacterized protein
MFGGNMLKTILYIIFTAFSFKITEVILHKISKKLDKYIVYIWGILLLFASFVMDDTFVYQLPKNTSSVMMLFIVVLIINCIISRGSGYSPQGLYLKLNFMIAFPIFEEIAFRGIILSRLMKFNYLNIWVNVLGIFSATPAILISAFLFAIAHLQYYRLSKISIRYMTFAILGGIFFGVIASVSESILLTIPLHMAFNCTAVYYDRRARIKGIKMDSIL